MYNGIKIIAEVKTKSLYGFKSNKSWEYLFDIANEIGDIISIHTDIRWGGSFDLIKKARRLTKKPILAKGIHRVDDDIVRAIEYGADHVLVVGRIPGVYLNSCFIEPLNLDELSGIPNYYRVVWNSRDLSNGGLKNETFEEARELWKWWLCQASNIKSLNDIKKGADAVLVGSYLENFYGSMIR